MQQGANLTSHHRKPETHAEVLILVTLLIVEAMGREGLNNLLPACGSEARGVWLQGGALRRLL